MRGIIFWELDFYRLTRRGIYVRDFGSPVPGQATFPKEKRYPLRSRLPA